MISLILQSSNNEFFVTAWSNDICNKLTYVFRCSTKSIIYTANNKRHFVHLNSSTELKECVIKYGYLFHATLSELFH